jgi:hypothetical protein
MILLLLVVMSAVISSIYWWAKGSVIRSILRERSQDSASTSDRHQIE